MTPSQDLTVLVIGSGGREHALVRACLRSNRVKKVIAAPGNGGMAQEVDCFPIDVEDGEAVTALAKKQAVNFAIVGPEAPLATGMADTLRNAGIATYGPGKSGALLEASKAYCKDFFTKYDIATAEYGTFSELDEAIGHLDGCQFPVVVKADGLAAGKGVIICQNREEAENAVRSMLTERAFGDAGDEIVIEEFLEGEEASIMVIVSGDKYVTLPVSQDHKRIGEGDTGPNTGGMGAYAPAAVVDDKLLAEIKSTIIEPTLAGFQSEGIDYRGTLFIGLMLTPNGPRVLEFNVRFGDPECQVLLPLCKTDPVTLMHDCATGRLDPDEVEISDQFAMIVVLASKNYPGSYPKGEQIQLPKQLPDHAHIIHAGTKLNSEQHIETSGGRVLGVVAFGPTLKIASDRAYSICDQIHWPSKYLRRDIGWRQLAREV